MKSIKITDFYTIFLTTISRFFKIARDRLGNIVNFKPEYDDISNLALKLNRPFREIHEKATQQARRDLMDR